MLQQANVAKASPAEMKQLRSFEAQQVEQSNNADETQHKR